jgi:N-acetylglucosaminyldiphosphoundecaprenol N-acetyl-beta-D-mannosaminyltransferase
MTDLHSRQLALAGIRIDALEHEDLLLLMDQAKSADHNLLVLHHNLHSLFLYCTNASFRKAYSKASWVYIDGMPIVWCGQFAGLRVNRKHRITFLECFDSILGEAERRGWRVFYLGSAPEVLTTGLALLRSQYPRLTIEGHHGFFVRSGEQNDEVVTRINDFGADILFIGMGMPIQELWLAEHFSKLKASAILTSGATLDYVTGHAYRPPAWAGPIGLYGVCRLFSDPKRLWRRYLVEPIVLARHLTLPLIRQRWGRQSEHIPDETCATSPSGGQVVRVCMMNDNFYRSSGAARAIRRISQALSDVDYCFAACKNDGDLEDVSWVEDGKFERFDLKSPNPVRIVRELIRFRRWFELQRCDLVHCHHRRLSVLLQLAQVPVLYTGHLAFQPAAWFRWLHPRRMTAVSRSVAMNIFETTGREVIRCINNPTHFPTTPPPIDVSVVRNRAVCIARLEPIKGHTHLLAAWKLLRERGHHYELDLIGEGSLRSQLESQLERDGLQETVKFQGFTNDVSRFIAGSLFAILVSEVEGQPLAVLEAAAMGRPTLLTSVPGSIDVLPQDGKLRNSIEYANVEALADTIEDWFQQPDQVVEEGERFFRFLRASSDSNTIAREYKEVYQNTVAGYA